MDPIQCVVEDVNPCLETAGLTFAVVADGYDTINDVLLFRLGLNFEQNCTLAKFL